MSASARMVERSMMPVVVARTGQPPLEFVGRCIARNIAAPPLGIELWEKQSGGFVVVHPGEVADRSAVQAVAVAHMAAARDHLMALCAKMTALPTVVDVAARSPDMNLSDAVALLNHHRSMAQEVSELVAETMADWDLLCPVEVPQ